MKVLVTGGCGFIGSHLVDVLINLGHDVLVIDNLSTGDVKNLNEKAKLYAIDILSDDVKAIFLDEMPEVVYHMAAQIDVQKSIQSPQFDAEQNIIGTINILNMSALSGVKRVVYSSSAAVYGDPVFLPVTEAHPINPASFYGISKYVPERYIQLFCSMHNMKYNIFRFSNVYGMRQASKGEGGVVSIFINKFKNGEAPIIFGTGEQTRDFIYVKDVAQVLVDALENSQCDNRIFNLSTNTQITINELFTMMAQIIGVNCKPIYEKSRDGDILDSVLDNTLLCQNLNWLPKYSLYDGLKETIEYYI